jgi:hypothetical protein
MRCVDRGSELKHFPVWPALKFLDVGGEGARNEKISGPSFGDRNRSGNWRRRNGSL